MKLVCAASQKTPSLTVTMYVLAWLHCYVICCLYKPTLHILCCQVSPQDCTGCEVCVEACPEDALVCQPLKGQLPAEAVNWGYYQQLPNR